MDFEWADMRHYAAFASALVFIAAFSVLVVAPKLESGVGDLGASAIMVVLIALVIFVAGLNRNRDRRIANTERMVKALYDHFGLGGGPAGRVDGAGGDSGAGGDGRGRNGISEGRGTKGTESRNGG